MKYLNYNIRRNEIQDDPLKNQLISKRNETCDSSIIYSQNTNSFENINRYPDIFGAIKKLSSVLKTSSHNLVFGNGSDDVLKNLFLTLEYETVTILSDSYKMSFFYNDLLKKRINVENFKYENKKFHLKNTWLHGDLLYLVSPHCPTGFEYNTEELMDISCRFKYVILDQAYTNPLIINDKLLRKNVVIVKSFSKLGGAPGLRIGYAITKNKNILHNLKCITSNHSLNSEAIRYINFIIKNKHLIEQSEKNYEICFEYIKSKYNLFGILCGNFAIFEFDQRIKDIGVEYIIDNKKFIRITLIDKESFIKYENNNCG